MGSRNYSMCDQIALKKKVEGQFSYGIVHMYEKVKKLKGLSDT